MKWKLVPVEPTAEMIKSAAEVWDGRKQGRFQDAYRAMLSAAPTPPERSTWKTNGRFCVNCGTARFRHVDLKFCPAPPEVEPVRVPSVIGWQYRESVAHQWQDCDEHDYEECDLNGLDAREVYAYESSQYKHFVSNRESSLPKLFGWLGFSPIDSTPSFGFHQPTDDEIRRWNYRKVYTSPPSPKAKEHKELAAEMAGSPTPPDFDSVKPENLADILDDYSSSGSHENDYPYASHLMQEAARLIRTLQDAPTPPDHIRDVTKKVTPPVQQCKCDMRTQLVGDGCEVCNPELAAEMKAQEDEPVAWQIEYTNTGLGLKLRKIHTDNVLDTYIETYPDAVAIPLFCHPADDKLRNAAEELVQWYDRLEPGNSIHAITLMTNLRAALEGK